MTEKAGGSDVRQTETIATLLHDNTYEGAFLFFLLFFAQFFDLV
jgi:hypothetical protein